MADLIVEEVDLCAEVLPVGSARSREALEVLEADTVPLADAMADPAVSDNRRVKSAFLDPRAHGANRRLL